MAASINPGSAPVARPTIAAQVPARPSQPNPRQAAGFTPTHAPAVSSPASHGYTETKQGALSLHTSAPHAARGRRVVAAARSAPSYSSPRVDMAPVGSMPGMPGRPGVPAVLRTLDSSSTVKLTPRLPTTPKPPSVVLARHRQVQIGRILGYNAALAAGPVHDDGDEPDSDVFTAEQVALLTRHSEQALAALTVPGPTAVRKATPHPELDSREIMNLWHVDSTPVTKVSVRTADRAPCCSAATHAATSQRSNRAKQPARRQGIQFKPRARTPAPPVDVAATKPEVWGWEPALIGHATGTNETG